MTTPPEQIGPYHVESEIGRGGMGVVYLATDSRLDRKVAIKALPEHFASDPDRLARFEREAKTLASLNHPNVAGIHGVEEVDGARYLVMEFVDGETLAERLDRGPLPLDEALEVCSNVAAGLEAAHNAGVIHRDLKPGNIKITPEGDAKVLDFGLARTEEHSSAGSSVSQAQTLSTPHSPTTPGVILGTAPYMSPEQARGRKVDKRSDIWSFGIVLYECLTGASPFIGETATDSIGAILHKDVNLDLLPPGTPRDVRRVIERCLERDRNERWRDIGDVRLELQSISRSPEESTSETHRGRGVPLGAVLIATLLALAIGIVGARWSLRTESPGVQRLSIMLPENNMLDLLPLSSVTVSPDGSMIAFVAISTEGPSGIYLRRLDERESVLLPGTNRGWCPAFTPDGRSVVFAAEGQIKRVPIDGGSPLGICTPAEWGGRTDCTGLTVTPDGRVIYGSFTARTLSEVPLRGGTPRVILEPDEDPTVLYVQPHSLPNRTVLFARRTFASERVEEIRAIAPDASQARLVVENATMPIYTGTGHLIFVRAETGMAAPFDIERLTLLEDAAPINIPAWVEEFPGTLHLGVSQTGVLAYAPVTEVSSRMHTLAAFDSEGERSPLADRAFSFDQIALSPDGRLGALTVPPGPGDYGASIWLFDFGRNLLTLLTTERGSHQDPVFSRDGRWVYYTRYDIQEPDIERITRRRVDGAGEPESLYASEHELRIMAPLNDGAQILALRVKDRRPGIGTRSDIIIIDLAGESPEVRPWLETNADESDAEPSPDERWIAYTSDFSGRSEVYVRPLLGDGPRLQISTDGGSNPEWAVDGSGVFFVERDADAGRRMMFAPIEFAPEASDGAPTVRPAVPRFDVDPTWVTDYELLPDGRIVLGLPVGDAGPTGVDRIDVELNWFTELERLFQNR